MTKRSFITLLISILILLAVQQISMKPVLAGGGVVSENQLILSNKLNDTISAPKNQINSPSQVTLPVANYISLSQPKSVQATIRNTFLPMSYMTKEQDLVYSSSLNQNSVKALPRSVALSVETPHEVAINLVANKQINLTDPIVLSGNLKDIKTGTGVADKSIKFYTNGAFLAQTHTNTDGTYQAKINKNLPAGDYQVTATFTGAHLLAAASTNIAFTILPATVQIQTIPSVAGITFKMDGKDFVSGQDGMASVQIAQAGQYRLDVLIDQYSNESQQVQFGRWTQESSQPFRMVQVPNNDVIQVGLNVYHKVSLKFVDLANFGVDPSRVSSITIRSIQGDFFTLKPGDTPWLPAIRTARRQTGLEETDLLYSVDSVIVDGSNVVNSAQQRFFAKTNDTWGISLLLYSLHVSAKDALIRIPVGASVDVTMPSGQTVNYPLDKSGVLDLHGLARGNYRVNLIGVKGLGTSSPVALSRNQVVNLKIVTKLDMFLFISMSSGLAIGLIIYGRPWLLHYLSGKRHIHFRQTSKDFGA